MGAGLLFLQDLLEIQVLYRIAAVVMINQLALFDESGELVPEGRIFI
jgi:hypothetical protein